MNLEPQVPIIPVELVGKVWPRDFEKRIKVDRTIRDVNTWRFTRAPRAGSLPINVVAACGGATPAQAPKTIPEGNRAWYITAFKQVTDNRGNVLISNLGSSLGVLETEMRAGKLWPTGSTHALVRLKITDSEGAWDIEKKILTRP